MSKIIMLSIEQFFWLMFIKLPIILIILIIIDYWIRLKSK